jgi:ribokinase
MKVAVVGHSEVVEFARVDHVPEPGEIVHTLETWTAAAGGGAVAAVQLLKLAGAVTFFTALGDDAVGHRAADELRGQGVRVECTFLDEPQRRGFTYIDRDGERTITVIGRKLVARAADPLPWDELDDTDAVYFTGGDPDALREARRARVLVATARELPTLLEARVQIDALVRSAKDSGERYHVGELTPPPKLVVSTAGHKGGRFIAGDYEGHWEGTAPPGPVVDAYGAGDSFAAGLAFALGEGKGPQEALEFASRCGASAMTGKAPFGGQLTLGPSGR